MKLKFYCSILIVLQTICCYAQFEISPYINGISNIKDGFLEAGPEVKHNDFAMQLYARLPLTDKKNNLLQIDRFTSTGRGILAIQYTVNNVNLAGPIKRLTISLQNEYGYTNYKYYLTGDKKVESSEKHASYASELKIIGFRTNGAPNARQYSPQFGVRYAYDWNAADEVAVIGPPNSNSVTYASNMIIEKPTVKPTFSPAFSLQYYPGKGNFSYSPTIYYDFKGKTDTDDPFGDLQRMRLEAWVFFYPAITNSANMKIGLTPFFSIRTKGTDSFQQIEHGWQFTIKFATTFLRFF